MANFPRHGVGSLGHGFTPACDRFGDMCNNGACRENLTHMRCTPKCTALVVWDEIGCWAPEMPDLRGQVVRLADLIAEAKL